MPTQEQPTVLHRCRDDELMEEALSTPDIMAIPGSPEAIQVVGGSTTLDHSAILASARTQHPLYPPTAPEEPKEQAKVAKTGWRGRLSLALPLFYRRSSLAEGTPLPGSGASDAEPPPRYGRTSSRLSSFISPISSPSTRSARNHPPGHHPPSLRPAPGRDTGVYGNSSSGHIGPTVVEPPPAFGEKQSPAIMPKAFFFYGCKYPALWGPYMISLEHSLNVVLFQSSCHCFGFLELLFWWSSFEPSLSKNAGRQRKNRRTCYSCLDRRRKSGDIDAWLRWLRFCC